MLSYVSKFILHTVINTGCLHQIYLISYIRVISDLQHIQLLQHDIDNLVHLSILWQLKFNISICNLLHLGQPHGYDEYLIDGTIISSNNVAKGLGKFMDD